MKDTVEKYIGYFKDSFIIQEARRYDLKGRKEIGAIRKYYFCDTGLRNARLIFAFPDEGQILENVVYNELIYNGYSVNVFNMCKGGVMSRETEMIFREFEKYMDEHGRPETEQDVNDMMQAFMLEYNNSVKSREPLTPATASSADDYIELAARAASLDEAIGYAKRAVKLEPDNLDAELYYVALSAKDYFDRLNKIEKLVHKGSRMMEEQGYFDEEYNGAFWGFHQTRPYMRVRQAHVDALLDVCMFEAAVIECEDMIRLSENDNIGARYTLMHLYALEGNEEKALELYDRYTEDGAMMLLPLAVLYYKKKDLKTALKYLKQIMKHNPDLKKFLKTAAELGDPLPDDFDP